MDPQDAITLREQVEQQSHDRLAALATGRHEQDGTEFVTLLIALQGVGLGGSTEYAALFAHYRRLFPQDWATYLVEVRLAELAVRRAGEYAFSVVELLCRQPTQPDYPGWGAIEVEQLDEETRSLAEAVLDRLAAQGEITRVKIEDGKVRYALRSKVSPSAAGKAAHISP